MNSETQTALTPEEQLEVLHPEQTLTIAGEDITVHEFGFIEGMELHALVMPLAEALGDLLREQDAHLDQLLKVFAEHGEAFNTLLARSVNKPVEWLNTLDDSDGMALSLAFWSVNKGFFVRRALVRIQQERAPQQMGAARDNLAAQLAPESCTPA